MASSAVRFEWRPVGVPCSTTRRVGFRRWPGCASDPNAGQEGGSPPQHDGDAAPPQRSDAELAGDQSGMRHDVLASDHPADRHRASEDLDAMAIRFASPLLRGEAELRRRRRTDDRRNHAPRVAKASRSAGPEVAHPYAGARASPPAPRGELGSSPAFSASMSEIPLLLLEWCSPAAASSAFRSEDSSKGRSPRLRDRKSTRLNSSHGY